MNDKFTLRDFLKRYATDEKCLEEIKNMRWSENIPCKKCKKNTPHYKITGRMQYACQFCGTHIAPLAGTVFEKSTTSLTLWFYAMFLMINTRSGISAKQLQRETGVTYKTAWRMFHQIRKLMAETSIIPLDGEVEVDETYVGGKAKNRARTWIQGVEEEQKQVVMGMVQRGGKVYLKHIPTNGKWALIKQIQEHISPKARIITDEWRGYHQLTKAGYTHDIIKHKTSQYVKGTIHTQNIENVWSHLKRGIFGVYRHVSKKYLQAYSDEFAWRYNNRKGYNLFLELLKEIPSTRLLRVVRLS